MEEVLAQTDEIYPQRLALTEPKVSSVNASSYDVEQLEPDWACTHQENCGDNGEWVNYGELGRNDLVPTTREMGSTDGVGRDDTACLVRCCGEDRPVGKRVLKVTVTPSAGHEFVTVKDYISTVHPWLMSKRSDIMYAKTVHQEMPEPDAESLDWVIDSGPRHETILKSWYIGKPNGGGKTVLAVPHVWPHEGMAMRPVAMGLWVTRAVAQQALPEEMKVLATAVPAASLEQSRRPLGNVALWHRQYESPVGQSRVEHCPSMSWKQDSPQAGRGSKPTMDVLVGVTMGVVEEVVLLVVVVGADEEVLLDRVPAEVEVDHGAITKLALAMCAERPARAAPSVLVAAATSPSTLLEVVLLATVASGAKDGVACTRALVARAISTILTIKQSV
ncbi:hypothetical protein Micbo1qcDRAFT_174827 [Microdochium bolleyi]|uniref:Uncharacterized protein n=1 Tax=Microdochium bolleyi TaxID=196109 RepID=A0A136J3I0_9PEZI|nr:hypothetical protein Micbo1qcDRAFT_174827 [Microdochium bolleyi]